METVSVDAPVPADVNDAAGLPQTLSEALQRYSNVDSPTMLLSAVRWPNGTECPRCHSRDKHSYVSTRHIWKCKSCRRQFSPKAGTIFEDSPIGLDKWFAAVWCVANDRDRLTPYKLHQTLGVTQTTAQFMLRRIHLAVVASLTNAEGTGPEEYDKFFRLLNAIAVVPKTALYELDPLLQPKRKPAP